MDSVEPSDGDVHIGGRMMTTIWVLYGIATVIVGIRLYSQMRITHQLGLGDAFMTLSTICGLVLCAMLTKQYDYGLGRHWFYLSNYEKVMVLEYNTIGQAFAVMAPAFGRMAIVMMMYQIFGTMRWRRLLLWTLFWGTFIINSVTLILIYVQCDDYTGYVQGALNSATDIILTVLPAHIFWDLQITRGLKVGLAVLLGLSIFAFIACVIKTTLLPSRETTGDDYSFKSVPFFTWVIVECAFVNIAASVPLIRPLWLKYMKKGSFSDSTNFRSYEMNNRYGPSTNRGARLESHDCEMVIDNQSEEHILPIEGTKVENGGGIAMETMYDITYDSATDGKKEGAIGTKVWVSCTSTEIKR